MARLHFYNDGYTDSHYYDYVGGGSSSTPNQRFAYVRRTRPETVQSDHKSPTHYDHVKSNIKGFSKTLTFNAYYHFGKQKRISTLTNGSDIPYIPPLPQSVIPEVPVQVMGPGNYVGYPTVQDPRTHPAYGNMVNSCLSRLRQNKMEIGTELAELRETSSYLARRSVDLARALIMIKKGQVFKGVKKGFGNKSFHLLSKLKDVDSKVLARTWLESQYAVTPLVYSVYDGFKLAQEGISKSLSVSASAKRNVQQSHEYSWPKTSTLSIAQWKGSSQVDLRIKLRGYINDPEMDFAKQLGLYNPLQIIWELVPFSFVVDWILPVGDFLTALSGPKGLDFLGGYTSIKATQSLTYRYHDDKTKTGYGYLSDTVRKGKCSGEGYRRIKFSSFPTAHFPTFDNIISQKNMITLAALSRVLFSR